MLLQTIAILVAIVVVYNVIFMIRHPFWSRQPVFHFHKFWLWFRNNTVINKTFDIQKKYYTPTSIQFYTTYTIPKDVEDSMVDLIQTHYLQERNVMYEPTKEGIMTYFKGCNNDCFFSLFYGNNWDKNNLQGVLTSRPLLMTLEKNIKHNVDYVDYLCVHKEHRKSGVSPKLIHTYSVHTQQQAKCDDKIYLFKREGETTSYIPLVVYPSFYYDLKYWNDNTCFPKPYKLTQINDGNKRLLLNYLTKHPFSTQFNCVVQNDLGNLEELIKEDIIIPFVIHNDDDIICVYFFRNGYMFYNNKKILDNIGSVLFYPEFKEFFELGFKKSVVKLRDTDEYSYINIEGLAHNSILLKSINTKYRPLNTEYYSYYLFNFVRRPFLNTETFILC